MPVDIPDYDLAGKILEDGEISPDEHKDVIRLLRFQLGLREHYEARIDQLNKEHESEKEVMLDRHDDAMEILKSQFTKVLAFIALGIVMSFITILIGLGHDPGIIATSAFTLVGGLIASVASQYYKSIPAHIRTFFSNLVRNLPKIHPVVDAVVDVVKDGDPGKPGTTTEEKTNGDPIH